jgi:hypothetical protein
MLATGLNFHSELQTCIPAVPTLRVTAREKSNTDSIGQLAARCHVDFVNARQRNDGTH